MRSVVQTNCLAIWVRPENDLVVEVQPQQGKGQCRFCFSIYFNCIYIYILISINCYSLYIYIYICYLLIIWLPISGQIRSRQTSHNMVHFGKLQICFRPNPLPEGPELVMARKANSMTSYQRAYGPRLDSQWSYSHPRCPWALKTSQQTILDGSLSIIHRHFFHVVVWCIMMTMKASVKLGVRRIDGGEKTLTPTRLPSKWLGLICELSAHLSCV